MFTFLYDIYKNLSMAEWAKGLGLLVHNEARCEGGCRFDSQPGQYTRRVFHPARLPGKAFSVNMSLNFKFRIIVPVEKH